MMREVFKVFPQEEGHCGSGASEAVQHLLAVNWKSSCKSRFGMARMPREYISRLYSLQKKEEGRKQKLYDDQSGPAFWNLQITSGPACWPVHKVNHYTIGLDLQKQESRLKCVGGTGGQISLNKHRHTGGGGWKFQSIIDYESWLKKTRVKWNSARCTLRARQSLPRSRAYSFGLLALHSKWMGKHY